MWHLSVSFSQILLWIACMIHISKKVKTVLLLNGDPMETFYEINLSKNFGPPEPCCALMDVWKVIIVSHCHGIEPMTVPPKSTKPILLLHHVEAQAALPARLHACSCRAHGLKVPLYSLQLLWGQLPWLNFLSGDPALVMCHSLLCFQFVVDLLWSVICRKLFRMFLMLRSTCTWFMCDWRNGVDLFAWSSLEFL